MRFELTLDDDVEEQPPAPTRMGHPHAALLALIEESTATSFFDKCLLAPIDVSHASWIFTANTLEGIAAPLRSRLDIIEVTAPGEEHFDALLATLTRDVARRWGVAASSLPGLAPAAEATLRALRPHAVGAPARA